ncbi:metal-dependent hydrolase [Microaerobacter geothermalis]|uniref:metal-dependent hydrolase n=1 Tax=Microaerobacter geothermalis TaxID=674972 RepID=UPI001F3573C8|nr:metal-dependent hydrolase [Microaerobacter geothermalis]MCF6094319.1 metal-dependent hydrolase [Microaerobacter geothermalis]
MTGPTHLVVAITVTVYAGQTSPSALIVAGISSLLPDIDVKSSLIGRTVPVLPRIIENTVGHRTLTHSIWMVLLLSIGIYWLYPFLFMPFIIGYVSHLVLDILTGGVFLFYPYRKRTVISLGIPPVFIEALLLMGMGVFFAFNWQDFLERLF